MNIPDTSTVNIHSQLAASFVHQTGKNLFLTGRAGTGKTTFLRQLMDSTRKKAVVVAPTGVAAINAGGVTIHSFFQLPLGPYVPGRINTWSQSSNPAYDRAFLLKNIRINSTKRKLIEELELLIIDEISMVRADLLDAVDSVLRYFRYQPSTPFGGVQVLMIGDLFQLPPVTVNDEWELLSNYYNSPFFFDARVYKEAIPLTIELQTIYRQNEPEFIELLNRVRNNVVTSEDLSWLNTFYKHAFKPGKNDNYITLTSHNYLADRINDRELNALPGKKHIFKAEVEGIFNDKSFPADELLCLKEGAQVMFIRNDKGESRRYYNGKIGVVKEIEEEGITISFPNEDQEILLEREEWKNIRYRYNEESKQVEEEPLGTFKQYPVRLAWAVTIHKSQGLTFEKAIIDAGSSFSAGQVYVALSRLTSMEGLVLRSKINQDCIHCEPHVVHFMSNLKHEDELKNILKEERKIFIHQSLLKCFDFSRMISEFQHFIEDYKGKSSPQSNDAIINGTIWLEAAKELKVIADKFLPELKNILKQGEKGYARLEERMKAANDYFSKRLKAEVFEKIEQHRKSVASKSKTKKYLKVIRSLQIVVKDADIRLKNAGLLVEGLVAGVDNLALVNQLDQENEGVLEVAEVKQKPAKGETQRISLEMFKDGKDPEEIALARGLAKTTIEGHLAQFIKTGELSVNQVVSEEKINNILTLISQSKDQQLNPIKAHLGDEYSYGEIRAVLNHWQWLQGQEEKI